VFFIQAQGIILSKIEDNRLCLAERPAWQASCEKAQPTQDACVNLNRHSERIARNLLRG
jgi:hypothetical protein